MQLRILCFGFLDLANSNAVRLTAALESVALGLCGLSVSLVCLDSVPCCHFFSMLQIRTHAYVNRTWTVSSIVSAKSENSAFCSKKFSRIFLENCSSLLRFIFSRLQLCGFCSQPLPEQILSLMLMSYLLQ